ncbi:LIM domain protein [Cavenderia fasciculata]|uniref:LIM domain protein n=1 Tax=Cavenderia fasciculata TaxID=261658 RepID=F4PP29_CACFS|nr:LIM domain protein [Cavenderia fasciculata]EGG22142.1 LIM domain protein [Cavenderia fasciculata]|eukprot:XP_004359993.1 LIM domain protein [Cavenderia fasciculata]
MSEEILICKRCQKNIDSGESIHAMDADWHSDCWGCAECHTAFETQSFYKVQGLPICKNCYLKKQSKCKKCSQPIAGQKLTDNIGQEYHPECFTCSNCNKNIDANFFIKDTNILCPQCNDQLKEQTKKQIGKELGNCYVCKKPCNTSDGTVIVVGPEERYHRPCFKCVKCHNEIKGEFYTLSDVKSKNYVCMACNSI